jgi:hypothetical protein
MLTRSDGSILDRPRVRAFNRKCSAARTFGVAGGIRARPRRSKPHGRLSFDASGSGSRKLHLRIASLGRLLKWLVALLVASLFIPAITTQWSDRQKELDIKAALISQITESAAATVQDSVFLVSDESKGRRGSCWLKTNEFRIAYQALGERLLSKRQPLLATITESPAAGYNVGFRDFLRQVLPPY